MKKKEGKRGENKLGKLGGLSLRLGRLGGPESQEFLRFPKTFPDLFFRIFFNFGNPGVRRVRMFY